MPFVEKKTVQMGLGDAFKMKLDKTDKELIANLFEDGRAKLTELGTKLGEPGEEDEKSGLSHVAVSKRLTKLVENEIIKVQANLNIVQAEYVSAFVMIETKEYEAQKRIIERFRLCPRVVFMDLVSGKYNIILRVMAPSFKELECFLNYSWLKNEEGIRNLEIYISTTNIKPKYIPVPMIACEKKRPLAPCGFRCNMCDLFRTGECKGCPATHFPEQRDIILSGESMTSPAP